MKIRKHFYDHCFKTYDLSGSSPLPTQFWDLIKLEARKVWPVISLIARVRLILAYNINYKNYKNISKTFLR